MVQSITVFEVVHFNLISLVLTGENVGDLSYLSCHTLLYVLDLLLNMTDGSCQLTVSFFTSSLAFCVFNDCIICTQSTGL